MAKQLTRGIKCVLAGDSSCGKTSMLFAYVNNAFTEEYTPTVLDNYTCHVNVDNEQARIALWDASGSEEFDQLRPVSYPFTDVFLLVFAIDEPSTFFHISSKWVKEIQAHAPDAAFILVGTRSDLREEVYTLEMLQQKGEVPITYNQGQLLAQQIGAVKYMECSAATKYGLQEIFELIVRVARHGSKKAARMGGTSSSNNSGSQHARRASNNSGGSLNNSNNTTSLSNSKEKELKKKKAGSYIVQSNSSRDRLPTYPFNGQREAAIQDLRKAEGGAGSNNNNNRTDSGARLATYNGGGGSCIGGQVSPRLPPRRHTDSRGHTSTASPTSSSGAVSPRGVVPSTPRNGGNAGMPSTPRNSNPNNSGSSSPSSPRTAGGDSDGPRASPEEQQQQGGKGKKNKNKNKKQRKLSKKESKRQLKRSQSKMNDYYASAKDKSKRLSMTVSRSAPDHNNAASNPASQSTTCLATPRYGPEGEIAGFGDYRGMGLDRKHNKGKQHQWESESSESEYYYRKDESGKCIVC